MHVLLTAFLLLPLTSSVPPSLLGKPPAPLPAPVQIVVRFVNVKGPVPDAVTHDLQTNSARALTELTQGGVDVATLPVTLYTENLVSQARNLQNVPYMASGSDKVQSVLLGQVVSLIPQMEAKGVLHLGISASDTKWVADGPPQTTTREVSTHRTLQNGETFVIGTLLGSTLPTPQNTLVFVTADFMPQAKTP